MGWWPLGAHEHAAGASDPMSAANGPMAASEGRPIRPKRRFNSQWIFRHPQVGRSLALATANSITPFFLRKVMEPASRSPLITQPSTPALFKTSDPFISCFSADFGSPA